MPQVLSWQEWAGHDGVGLAELVRKGEVTPRELSEQAAAAIARTRRCRPLSRCLRTQ